MINVTKTFFPPIEEYYSQLKRVWKNEWLTNRGELVIELEAKLKEYLSVSNIIVMANGTLPLQIAVKILAQGGEVITTPFSYVATTASILWENCVPVFVDIHPEYLTIDETKLEAAINKNTKCILATHVFGNPCNIEVISEIAKKHNLKIIYDAAHAFGVTYNGKSIFEFGDVSTCSFHATKLFHTGEGGAVFCNNDHLNSQLFYSHNFGHNGPLAFHGLGINGKISELQAAMGLSVLPHMPSILANRKQIVDFYDSHLNFSRIKKMKLRENTKWNYSYYPVIFNNEEELLATQVRLNEKEIFPRRYFYPSLNTLPFINGNQMENSESIAKRILCLPLAHSFGISEIQKVVDLFNKL